LSLSILLCACGDDGATNTAAATTTGDTTAATTTGASAAESSGSTTGAQPTTSGGSEASATDTTGPGPTSSATSTTDATDATDATDTTNTTGPGETTDDTTTGGGVTVYDPNVDGPWQVEHVAGDHMVDGVKIPMDAYYPAGGPEPGPHPVVLISHGFQLPPSQYTSYAQRLASHGYVALTVDFKAGLFDPNHVVYAKQVLGGIDWVAQEATLGPISDTDNVGLTGHSLGGKLSVIAASMDTRVRASITLDPVDGAMNCDPQKCPDASELLPLDIPLGFVGETLDAMGGFMSCAPAADNFLTFYKNTTAPSLAVTVLGANHMSFLDDLAGCGFTCSLCNQPTLDNAVVNDLSRAFVVAFYGRHLRGISDYDLYLTGAEAQARYVDMGLVEIASK
jgi:acetyl esterase/lipase